MFFKYQEYKLVVVAPSYEMIFAKDGFQLKKCPFLMALPFKLACLKKNTKKEKAIPISLDTTV